MKRFFIITALAFVLILTFACRQTETARTDTEPVNVTDTTTTASAAAKTYTMTGTLVSRDAAKNEVTIDNDPVPGGVLAKMVMAYELGGTTVNTLPPDGSRITSTLHEQDGKYWVSDVKAIP